MSQPVISQNQCFPGSIIIIQYLPQEGKEEPIDDVPQNMPMLSEIQLPVVPDLFHDVVSNKGDRMLLTDQFWHQIKSNLIPVAKKQESMHVFTDLTIYILHACMAKSHT